MENQSKQKKFWKPPSFEDFNNLFPNKKIKLDPDDVEDKYLRVSKEIVEPRTAKELAIHPKKIGEVKNWLKRNLNSRAPILFISGPSGCGKTITLKVLANEEGIQIKEWINPISKTEHKTEGILQSDIYDKFNFIETSQTDKFDDFIFRSSRYNSLIGSGKTVLILVKDMPNIFIWRPKTFHDFLEKYKSHGKSPIVFIITDDHNLNVSNSLFPSHIKSKHNITCIKFNPINHSSSMKILRTFCDFYCSEKISLQFLEEVSKNSGGDLRSAINDLVLILRTSGLNLKPKFKKSNLKKGEVLVESKPISVKNVSFDFYHVLGRILYPKLMTDEEKLNSLNPNRIFLHDVQKIVESLSGSHLPILHENYVQTFTKLKDVVDGADCFSFCDIFNNHQELEECTSLVGVLTLMLKNTTPKKTGFKPIKKSFRFEKTNMDCNVDVPEYFNHYLSKRDLLLDIMPFMNFLKISDEQSLGMTEGSENCEVCEDVIEIEDFDD